MSPVATIKIPKGPKAAGAPKLAAIKIKGAKNGGFTAEHIPPADSFRSASRFIFPNTPGKPAVKALVQHLTDNVHKLWLGGKTMEPRVRGAGKAHREMQVETSSYPTAKPSSF